MSDTQQQCLQTASPLCCEAILARSFLPSQTISQSQDLLVAEIDANVPQDLRRHIGYWVSPGQWACWLPRRTRPPGVEGRLQRSAEQRTSSSCRVRKVPDNCTQRSCPKADGLARLTTLEMLEWGGNPAPPGLQAVKNGPVTAKLCDLAMGLLQLRRCSTFSSRQSHVKS